MPRTTKTITISLPPQMADQVEQVMQEEGRTKSELLREALRRYMQERQWLSLKRYASSRANAKGITSEAQVTKLIHARRVSQSKAKGRSR